MREKAFTQNLNYSFQKKVSRLLTNRLVLVEIVSILLERTDSRNENRPWPIWLLKFLHLKTLHPSKCLKSVQKFSYVSFIEKFLKKYMC